MTRPMTELTLQDRREIDDLYIRYCYAINELDTEEWVACFAAEGRFVPAFGAVRGEFRGSAQLASFATDPRRNRMTRHWNANIRLWTSAQPITATCYALLVDYSEPHPQLLAHVVYHDLLVHEAGQWRFLERRPAVDRARAND